MVASLQAKEGIRGRFWFVDSDLKGGTALKLDKTGKAILTVLRHLGRLTEVCLMWQAGLSFQLESISMLAYNKLLLADVKQQHSASKKHQSVLVCACFASRPFLL